MGDKVFDIGLFPRILFPVVESLLTEAIRAEQAVACTKEREEDTGAGDEEVVVCIGTEVATGGGPGSSSIPEVWDLWSLEREVTEEDSALRSTGTAWVSEWERS